MSETIGPADADGAQPDAQEAFYQAFRAQLTEFARSQCPPEIRRMVAEGRPLGRAQWSAWQAIMHARGWSAPGWPRGFGGTGWDLRQRLIFEEVMARNDCPLQYHHGLAHIGPVIIEFGTPAQHDRFLPGILDGSVWWCQGYSEPGSGSDLASLRTRAQRDGDHYVVDGQKIWTSHAHEADWIYALVRTSSEGRKHDGISMLLIALDSPGVTVRPIRTIDGHHHLNEVFFDAVRVPIAQRIGDEGQGWKIAKFLLERERLPPGVVARWSRLWQRVAALVAREQAAHSDTRDLTPLRHRLLIAEAELRGAREMLASAVDDLLGRRPLGTKPSALKMHCGEIAQRLMEIAFDAIGPQGALRLLALDGPHPDPVTAEWVHNYLLFRARTIAGGTAEVQRNVIARDLFGS